MLTLILAPLALVGLTALAFVIWAFYEAHRVRQTCGRLLARTASRFGSNSKRYRFVRSALGG